MAGIPESPEVIQHLNVTSNRRTSYQEFWDNLDTMLAAAVVHLFQEPAFEEAEILFAFDNVSYAFRLIGQRPMPRRFPRNLEDAWAFYGFPIENISDDLGVSPILLTRRATDIGFWEWPAPSDDEFVLVAAQLWLGEGLATEKSIFYVSRASDYDELEEQVRGMLRVGLFFGPESVCEIHFEINRLWYGPLLNTQDWEVCKALPDNAFRVNLLVVVIG